MPIYMEISRLHRCVMFVARGKISPEEIRGIVEKFAASDVRSFAKIVEVGSAKSDITEEQIAGLARFLSGSPAEKRGPIAFVVDPRRMAFSQSYLRHTEDQRPIRLFTSLRDARTWTEGILRAPRSMAVADPNREATMFVGDRRRELPPLRPS